MKRDKHLGLTISSDLHRKLAYVASYEGRSMTGQILFLIQKCVRDYEKEHGPIPEEPEGKLSKET